MPTGPTFDPYAVLKVMRTAEQEVIQGAFKALAFKYHPDRDASRHAAEKMADLNRAYALLRDATARAVHDRRAEPPSPGSPWPSPPGRMRHHLPLQPRAACSLSADISAGACVTSLTRTRITSCGSRAISSGIRYRTEIYGILRTMGVSAA